jgi:hypothetical protein
LCETIYIHRVENIASASEKIKTRPRNNILSHCRRHVYASRHPIRNVRKSENEGDEHLPFAGRHIIPMGDFHQFPPVDGPNSALFPLHPKIDPDALYGRNLYRQFTTVAWLRKHLRIRDSVWTNILSRLRIGQCTEEDISIIRSLILNRRNCPKSDFGVLPWSEAILITTRHTVWEAWNAACLT